MLDVSIIIVNYNTNELLKNCINSIYSQTKEISYEIIVSDNGSSDGSQEMLKTIFPEVKLIQNNTNLGFGAANNRALETAQGEFIFYLNSDTILLNNAIKLYYDYFKSHDDGKLGAIGGMLLNSDLTYTYSGGNFPILKTEIRNLIKQNIGTIYLTLGTLFKFKNMHKKHIFEEIYGDVEYITGAALFLKNNEYAKFDEDFFLYYEDTYLQIKMQNANQKRVIIEGPRIIHLNGGSVSEKMSIYRKASFSRLHYEFSRIKYLRKISKNSFTEKLGIKFCKFLILLSWSNPFIFRKTHPYFKTIRDL